MAIDLSRKRARRPRRRTLTHALSLSISPTAYFLLLYARWPQDTSPKKVSLGVGAYRDDKGKVRARAGARDCVCLCFCVEWINSPQSFQMRACS
jgi:hypothetical protein